MDRIEDLSYSAFSSFGQIILREREGLTNIHGSLFGTQLELGKLEQGVVGRRVVGVGAPWCRMVT